MDDINNKSSEEKRKILEDLEEKNLLYKLKRWEKNILNYLRNLFFKDAKMEAHNKEMERQKQLFNEELKKENENFEKASKELELKKQKEINLIEDGKNKIIEESQKKYDNLFEYLESIKNDKKKLIEFYNNSNNLFYN